MNCPKCNAVMESGYIPGQRATGVFWLPEDVKTPIIIYSGYIERANGIYIAPPSPILPTVPKAYMYICRKCRIGQFLF